ncbi:nucleotide-binding protein [Erythrobacter sp.]|jgi:predicted nucleotide-binding protein|uniref:nucleotide-binding protein n=1 Tax=Erythrobacter sp. TaxID=1042 RepID=UPI002EB04283|nr:nucleotide-binding protein [Erythrobacter sp.]
MTERDLFKSINDAVLDLQASQLQSYPKPLKRLANLLQHEDLAAANAKLTEGVDLSEFLASSPTSTGMVGTGNLSWPESERESLGLTFLLIQKFAENPDFMAGFGRNYYNGGRKVIASVHNVVSQLIIPFARDYKTFVESNGTVEPKLILAMSRRVFVVHGHDEGARETVARYLEKLNFEPIILHEQANMGRTIIEKVEAHGDVSFAVVLMTPDDEGGVLGERPKPRPRQNVLLELGYFIGRLGRQNVCALKRGVMELPSDFAGVVWEEMDEMGAWKLALARELAAVGHNVDLNLAVPRPGS